MSQSTPTERTAGGNEPSTQEDMAQCIGLLWSEIPLDKEAYVVARLRREGLYEVWERALDSNMGYLVGTPYDWSEGETDE